MGGRRPPGGPGVRKAVVATDPEYVESSASRAKPNQTNKQKCGVHLFGRVSIHSYTHITLHAYSVWFLVFLIPAGILSCNWSTARIFALNHDFLESYVHITLQRFILFYYCASFHSMETPKRSTRSLPDWQIFWGIFLVFLFPFPLVGCGSLSMCICLYSSVLSFLFLYIFCLPWSSRWADKGHLRWTVLQAEIGTQGQAGTPVADLLSLQPDSSQWAI